MLLGRWSLEGEVCTEYSDARLSVVWWEACLRKAWCLPDTILPKAFTFPAACLIPDSWVSGENPMISHQEGIAIFILNAAVITGTCGQTCWNFGTFKSFGTAVPRISQPTKKPNCGCGLPGEPQGGQRGRQVILHSHQLADSTLELEFSILIFVFTFIWLIAPELFADFVTFLPSATVRGSICYDCHTHTFGSGDVPVFQVWHAYLYLVFIYKLLLA